MGAADSEPRNPGGGVTMSIGELIARLEGIRRVHGDIPVTVCDGDCLYGLADESVSVGDGPMSGKLVYVDLAAAELAWDYRGTPDAAA